MNRTTASALVLALTALSAGHALAADAVKTRAQVEAERLEAIRTGDIVSTADGFGGQKLNELYPNLYPTKVQAPGKTRAQVEAERQEAIRTGDIVSTADGFGGQKLNELYPNRYPAKAPAAGKTRAQVEAERQLAVRSGALSQYPAY